MRTLYENLPEVEIGGRKLVGRVLFGLLVLVSILVGTTAGLLLVYTTDLPQVDALEAYRQSSAELKQAWSDPGLLEETLASHLGDMSGDQLLGIHVAELVTHSWDLGKAIDRQAEFDADILRYGLLVARVIASRGPGGTYFRPPTGASQELSEIDRIAALLGRSV